MVPLTTVSKGRGLHLLLGRDDVVRTFAVGFWYISKNNNDNNSSNFYNNNNNNNDNNNDNNNFFCLVMSAGKRIHMKNQT